MYSVLYLSYAPPAYGYGTRPFLGGSSRRAWAHTRRAVPKMHRDPSAFPFSGLLGRPAMPHSRRGLKLRGCSPEARGISSDGTHPTEPSSTRHGRPKRSPPTGQNAPLKKSIVFSLSLSLSLLIFALFFSLTYSLFFFFPFSPHKQNRLVHCLSEVMTGCNIGTISRLLLYFFP